MPLRFPSLTFLLVLTACAPRQEDPAPATAGPAPVPVLAPALPAEAPPEDGSEARLIFETDAAGMVSEWRIGLPPQVHWVEGCA